MVSDFKKLLTSMESCPLPGKNETVKVGIAGTNPVVFNDKEKKVLYDDKGD